MYSSLGTRLREQREQKGVSLAAIAEDTKISIALLEGLERDDVSRWPGGLFRRAYVRSYARAIGLDPEVVVREFVALNPDPLEESLAQAAAQAKPGEDGPTTRLAFLRAGLAKFQGETANAVSPGPVPGLERDLQTMASVCTALGRAADQDAVTSVLADAGRLLGARGLVVWVWDTMRSALRPAIAHGYPESMLQQLAALARQRDTAIGAAFHTAQPRVVTGAGHGTGAVVTPLLTPAGCVGVLAIEFANGAERRENVRAFITILGAQLSMLVPLSVPSAAAVAATA